MDYEKVWDELIAAAKVDADYQKALKAAEKLEDSYLEVCNSLSAEQKMVIEGYVAACETLGDYMALVAYRQGNSTQSALKIL